VVWRIIHGIGETIKRRVTDIQTQRLSGGRDYGNILPSRTPKVDVLDDDEFKVETIFRTKGRGRNKQYLVKWLHWPSKFN
jgi:hypothetical protein